MYRYRNDRSTRHNLQAFDKVLPKLGTIRYIKGYTYQGRYNTTHEAVLVKGTLGSARFGGLLFGYSGEGPRGTYALLKRLLGTSWDGLAKTIAFQTVRKDAPGQVWKIDLEKINPDNKHIQESFLQIA